MYKARHWLDYDSVAFAVLVVGMGAILTVVFAWRYWMA